MPGSSGVSRTNTKRTSRPSGRSQEPKNRLSSKRPTELFGRINANSLVTLVLQAAQVALEEKLVLQAIQDAKEDGKSGNVDTDEITSDPVEEALMKNGIKTTDRSTVQSVIVGMGEADFGTDAKKMEARKVLGMEKAVDTSRPYLLLDVRDEEEYKKCHIITASNYPLRMLARMFNYESKDLVVYKNVPGKMIIIYDDLERDGPRVASTLYERGYDNVYLLTGGLKSLHRSYPEGMITGVLPVQVIGSSPQVSRRPSRYHQSHSRTISRSTSTPTIAKFGDQAGSSGRKERKLKNQNGWNPYDGSGQLKENFDDEELEFLRKRLEHHLQPKLKKGTLAKETAASKAQMSRESSGKNGKTKPTNLAKPWY